MKTETQRALTFIVVGCLAAAALGFIVWQMSSPTRPTTSDIAMSNTTSTTQTQASYVYPGNTEPTSVEPDVENQTLAPINTEDPYLPPNAYVRPGNGRRPGTTAASSPTISLGSPTTTTQSFVPSEPAESTTTKSDGNNNTDVSSVPNTSDNSGNPPVTVSLPGTSEPSDTTEPSEPSESEEPIESTDPSIPESTNPPIIPSTPSSEEPSSELPTGTPPTEEPEAPPTDFIEEPTAPLNPDQPSIASLEPALN